MQALTQAYVGKVQDSAEFRRIVSLPRRTSPPEGTEKLSGLFAISGEQTLRPVQAQALAELHLVGGLVGLIRVGGGKTLITFLASEMLAVERPLLLVPAKLRAKTARDFEELSKHWRGRPMTIQSYERLGRANWTDYLERVRPDLIICDEAHKLKNVRAAVTRRVGRYMSAYPETHFVALSGTLTRRSLMDFAHIAEWCLGDMAPVPLEYRDLQEWCLAVDVEVSMRYGAGVLRSFSEGYSLREVREGVQRRIIETPGVVATEESPVDASLLIDEWWPNYRKSQVVHQAFIKLREEWETPDGVELISAADIWRVARELAVGFYYQWDPQPPKWWLEPRRRWAAFARSVLLRSRTLDSEFQVAQKYRDRKIYRDWAEVKKQFEPNVIPVWLDTDVVEKAAAWAEREGIIWTDLTALAEKLEEAGVPYYGRMGLDKNKVPIEDATGGIVASIEANKEGRNLQRYNRNLVLTPPSTGLAWEQLLGRTHRDGQQADEVTVEVFLGCIENINALKKARADARYQEQVTGSPQKLQEATFIFERL